MKKKIISWILMFVMMLWLQPQMTITANADEVITENIGASINSISNENMTLDANGTIKQGAMPCIGDANVLVFYTTFAGGEQNVTESPEEIEEIFFGENNNSLRTYYQKSSYGKVNISGDVYEYTTKYDSTCYDGILQDGTTFLSFAKVVDEIIDYYRDSIDWEQYDANNDGYIDGIYIVTRTSPSWESPNFVTPYTNQVGDLSISQACLLLTPWINTIAHETCHMFGMGDIYDNTQLNPVGIKTDCIMESGDGDLPGITKYFLGWIDNPIFISGTGSIDITLNSYSTTGEILIIPPNGDLNNPNWMIVEYLTKEANNYNNGVRIWKSNIVTDVVSSEKYEFLETLHPDEERNYYYQAGESVTPYTYPSTSYGVSYALDGKAKYIDEFGYSGISIHVNSSTGPAASITVEIDNEIAEIGSNVEMITGFSGSEFINDSNRILLATLDSPIELGDVEDVYLQSIEDGTVIPLEAAMSFRANQVKLYVSNQNAPLVRPNEEYKINLQDSLKTYYGCSVDIMNYAGTVTFESLPQPLKVQGEFSNGYQVYREFVYPKYHYLGNNIVSYFSVENDYLWLREIDAESKEISEKCLTLNTKLSRDDTLNMVTILDDKYYLLFWGPETNHEQVSLLEIYTLEGDLLDEYVMPSIGQLIRGESTNLTMLIDFGLYQVVFDESQLKLKKITDWRVLDKVWWDGDAWYGIGYTREWDRLICNLDSGEEMYYDFLNNDNLLSEAIDIIYKDNKIYIVTLYEDLNLFICDNEWNLLEEKVLLKDTGIDFVTKMEIGFQDDSLWVKLDGIPATNIVWYSSTFLATFDSDFELENYYRNGESDTHYTGNVLCLDSDRFFIGLTSTYKVLQRTRPNGNIQKGNATLSLEGEIYIEYMPILNGFDGIDLTNKGGLVISRTPKETEELTIDAANADETDDMIMVQNMYWSTKFNRWAVTTNGINAKEYGDLLYIRPFIEIDGFVIYGEDFNYSAEKYCRNMLIKSDSKELKAACAALLEFGAAAQICFNHNTDKLVDAGLDLSEYDLAYNSNMIDIFDRLGDNALVDNGYDFDGILAKVGKPLATLTLEGAVVVEVVYPYVELAPEEIAEAKLLVWTDDDYDPNGDFTYDTESCTFSVPLNKGILAGVEGYVATLKNNDPNAKYVGIPMKKCGDPIYFMAYFKTTDGEIYCSPLKNYSPDTYINSKAGRGDELSKVTEALAVLSEKARIILSTR